MTELNEQVDAKSLDDAIREWNKTSVKMAEAKAELEKLKGEAEGIESYIVQAMDQLEQEKRRVDDIMVKVKQKSEGGRVSYKKSFAFLLNKVNKQLRDAANDLLESTRGDKWIKKYLVKEERDQLNEGVIKRITDAIRTAIESFRRKLQGASKDIDLLDKLEKETVESTDYDGLAGAILESAIEGE
jgi:hypothetical protein